MQRGIGGPLTHLKEDGRDPLALHTNPSSAIMANQQPAVVAISFPPPVLDTALPLPAV